MNAESETVLWSGRPSLWNWWFELLVGDLLILLAAALWWAGYGSFSPWTLLGGAACYAGAWVQRLGERFTLTNQRVSAVTGLFARRVDEVELRDIRNITLEQSFAQRLLGLGDIGVSSAAGEGIEVTLRGVPDAPGVKEKVRLARRDAAGPEAAAAPEPSEPSA